MPVSHTSPVCSQNAKSTGHKSARSACPSAAALPPGPCWVPAGYATKALVFSTSLRQVTHCHDLAGLKSTPSRAPCLHLPNINGQHCNVGSTTPCCQLLRPSLPGSGLGYQPITAHTTNQPGGSGSAPTALGHRAQCCPPFPSTRCHLRPSASHHHTHCRTRPSHAGPQPLCWAASHHPDPPPEPPATPTSARASPFALCAPPVPCESNALPLSASATLVSATLRLLGSRAGWYDCHLAPWGGKDGCRCTTTRKELFGGHRQAPMVAQVRGYSRGRHRNRLGTWGCQHSRVTAKHVLSWPGQDAARANPPHRWHRTAPHCPAHRVKPAFLLHSVTRLARVTHAHCRSARLLTQCTGTRYQASNVEPLL